MKKSVLLTALGTGITGICIGLVLRGAPTATAQSQTPIPANITPKTQVPQEARSLSQGFASTARALRPSVVRLDIEQPKTKAPNQRRFGSDELPPGMERFFERFFGGEGMPEPGPNRGTGSGIIIDSQGTILTNSHVASKGSKVNVVFADGREFSANFVGADPKTDVAVLRIENPPKGLVAARLGDSSAIDVGEWVLAIGSPLGLDQSVTAGIISSRGRVTRNVHMSGERMREYIQTDAKINPGNSGGPLVNLQGEVIGINTLINVGPGGAYGFAIPINKAKQVAQAIIKDGRYRHAWLGVAIGDVKNGAKLGDNGEPAKGEMGNKAKSAPAKAAWVSRLMPEGPAAKAGVQVGDIITRIDNQPIEGASDVVDYVANQKVGTKITLEYQRNGKTDRLQLTLGELPDDTVAMNDPSVAKDRIGVQLQTLTPEMAGQLGIPQNTQGALITDVEQGSRAAKAGLLPEDVIIENNRKPIVNSETAVEALKGSNKGSHLLKIRRAGTIRYVTIPSQ
jgi:serine protease Do